MAKFTINVTQEHISKGVPKSRLECPVALAILGCVPNINRVSVWGSQIDLVLELDSSHQKIFYISAPYVVSNFVFDFDNSISVQPFSFELDI